MDYLHDPWVNFALRSVSQYRVKFQANFALAIFNRDGYHVGEVNAVGQFKKGHTDWRRSDTETKLVEPLFYDNHQIVVVVKEGYKEGQTIAEVKYTYTGTAFKTFVFYDAPALSCTSYKNSFAVCMEYSIFFCKLESKKAGGAKKTNKTGCNAFCNKWIHTAANKHGICALSEKHLAYPEYSHPGTVEVRDTQKFSFDCLIRAHTNPLIALLFNSDGKLLATASKNGIRVFLEFKGDNEYNYWQALYQFKRSITEFPCLTFSPCSEYLTYSGKSELIHTFRLIKEYQHLEALKIYESQEYLKRPPVKCYYPLTLSIPCPFKKIVAVRFFHKSLHLYVFKEIGLYEAYQYSTRQKNFILVFRQILTAENLT